MTTPTGSREEYNSKVARVSDTYALDGIDDELVERWTRETDRSSLRELAHYFNRRVLRAAADDHGLDTLDGEIANLYRLLTDDDVSAGMRTQARNRLEDAGVDVDRLLQDFVSHQAINRHLKHRLGVDRSETDTTSTPDDAAQRIYALQNRTATVTEDKLDQLRTGEDFTLGSFDVVVDITVTCTDCGTHLTIRELFENNGCSCDRSASA